MGEENNSSTASSAVPISTGSKAVPQPGPWRFFRGALVDASGADIVFTGVTLRLGGGALALANTRLASAAPDLLEALRLIEGGWVGDEIAEDDHEACVVALQKIAREALSESQAAAVAKPRAGKG